MKRDHLSTGSLPKYSQSWARPKLGLQSLVRSSSVWWVPKEADLLPPSVHRLNAEQNPAFGV